MRESQRHTVSQACQAGQSSRGGGIPLNSIRGGGGGLNGTALPISLYTIKNLLIIHKEKTKKITA